MKKVLLLIAFAFLAGNLFAQALPADTVPAIVKSKNEGDGIRFSAELRALRPISGAPEPFYSYFWEFGDGDFSFEKDPLHFYRDTAAVKVRLYATNNYDDGKRPPTRPQSIKPVIKPKPVLASNTKSGFFKDVSIALKTNCMPKPGDAMQLVVGYKNKVENGVSALSGTLAIFYNDKTFTKDNFVLGDTRLYNNETSADLKPFLQATVVNRSYSAMPYYAELEGAGLTELTSTFAMPVSAELKETAAAFRNHASWKFTNLQAGDEKFIFMELQTTPEMIKDTNAVVNISAVFIPDNPLLKTEIYKLELQIVASHDPNKMQLQNSRMNYRFTGKNRELTYKVRFQNTGKGPAKKVDVGVLISPVFDRATIQITDSKPKLKYYKADYAGQSFLDTLSNNQDSIHFVFNNIYLPGTKQEGVNDPDSTMGYVEYKIKFAERPKKLPFNSGAAIVFDKNEPIYTNRATGRFKKGISPAIIAGYGFPFSTTPNSFLNSKNIAIGVAVSTFAPHRKYLQAELYINSFSESTFSYPSTGRGKDTTVNGQSFAIADKIHTKITKVTTLNLVPLHLRYNFNKFIGAGVGAMVSLNLSERTQNKLDYLLIAPNGTGSRVLEIVANNLKDQFTNLDASFFADVQLGRVYAGPALGFRYLYNPQQQNSRVISYITWKF